MFYKLLILLGILFGSILMVENMIIPLQAYIFIWNGSTGGLAFIAMLVGVMLGYGVSGFMNSKDGEYEDNF